MSSRWTRIWRGETQDAPPDTRASSPIPAEGGEGGTLELSPTRPVSPMECGAGVSIIMVPTPVVQAAPVAVVSAPVVAAPTRVVVLPKGVESRGPCGACGEEVLSHQPRLQFGKSYFHLKCNAPVGKCFVCKGDVLQFSHSDMHFNDSNQPCHPKCDILKGVCGVCGNKVWQKAHPQRLADSKGNYFHVACRKTVVMLGECAVCHKGVKESEGGVYVDGVIHHTACAPPA